MEMPSAEVPDGLLPLEQAEWQCNYRLAYPDAATDKVYEDSRHIIADLGVRAVLRIKNEGLERSIETAERIIAQLHERLRRVHG